MLKTSAEYRKSVLKPSVVFLALPVIIEFAFNKSITSSSISLGVILSLCYPLFLVYMARAIAKKVRNQYQYRQTAWMFQ
jgi:large-conductance mechanosensitive channel